MQPPQPVIDAWNAQLDEYEQDLLAALRQRLVLGKHDRGIAYRTTFQGLPISIENPKGTYRDWEAGDVNGATVQGRTLMVWDYGYVRRTEGADGDHVDCYIGPNPDAPNVYCIRQQQHSGEPDEDKCMLGFNSAEEARQGWAAHHTNPELSFAGMREMTMEQFKQLLAHNWEEAPGFLPLGLPGDHAKWPPGILKAEQSRDAKGRWSSVGGVNVGSGYCETCQRYVHPSQMPDYDAKTKTWSTTHQHDSAAEKEENERIAQEADRAAEEEKLALLKAGDFDESKHPRDAKGKFGAGGGGETRKAKYRAKQIKEEEQEVRSHIGDALVDKANQALKEALGAAQLSTRTNAAALQDVLESGRFKTAYETGQSTGIDADVESGHASQEEFTELMDGRREAENQLYGYNSRTPDSDRPYYGYLSDPDAASDKILAAYGPVEVRFKDDLKAASTFTAGDSAAEEGQMTPSRVTSPSLVSALDATVRGGPDIYAPKQELSRDEKLKQLDEDIKAGRVGTIYGESLRERIMAGPKEPPPPDAKKAALHEKAINDLRTAVTGLDRKDVLTALSSKHGYVETQIHGGAPRKSDIAAVTFHGGRAPSGALSALLDKEKIPWSVSSTKLIAADQYLELDFQLRKAGFDESQHPRDERGRFGSGGSGGTQRFTKDSEVPKTLNGVALAPWTPPDSAAGWNHVEGQKQDLKEPPLAHVRDKAKSAGCIIREPDGRVWLAAPTEQFGGYEHTFPKGRIEDGISPQATAIKEAYEETGLKVNITGYAGDYEGDTTVTRYYTAERAGGTPAAHGWESEAVVLAHPRDLGALLNRSRDRRIARDHAGMAKGDFDEAQHPRDAKGRFGEGGEMEGTGSKIKLSRYADQPDLETYVLAKEEKGWGNVQTVALNDKLRATQEDLKAGGGVIRPPKEGEEYPLVARTDDGLYHIIDGHHRIDAAIVRGDSSMKMKVVQVDAKAEQRIRRGLITFKTIEDLFKDFDEAQHPRDAHGKFSPTGGEKLDGSKLKQIGPQKGSNPGGLFQHEDTGEKYYVKMYSNPNQVHTELAAMKVYEKAGISVPEGQAVKMPGDKLALATKWEEGVQNMSGPQLKAWADANPEKAGALFAASVATQNWDVVGQTYDNLVKFADGSVGVIDSGGSYLFRAQGGFKAYTEDPKELNTFLSGKNPQSAYVFGDVAKNPTFQNVASGTLKEISAGIKQGSVPEPPGVSKEQIAAKCDLASQTLDGKLALDGVTPPVSAAVEGKLSDKAMDLAMANAVNWETFKTLGPSVKSAMKMEWAKDEPNPAKPGTHAYQLYEIAKNGGSVAEFYKYALQNKLGAQAYLKTLSQKGVVIFHPGPGQAMPTPVKPLGDTLKLPKDDNATARAAFVAKEWANSPYAAQWTKALDKAGWGKVKEANTPSEVSALVNYTDGTFTKINSGLGAGHEMDDDGRKLLTAVKYWPIKTDKPLTRSDGFYPDIKQLVETGKVGDIFPNKTFWSTSTGQREGVVSWHLTPKPKAMTAGAHISKISNYKSEAEVLFPPRTNWRITNMQGSGSHWHIHAHEI